MPLVRNASGHHVWMSAPVIQVNNPVDFFKDDPDEYESRLEEARTRTIETIRFYTRPSCGRGLNHEVQTPDPDLAELASLVDFKDGKRARRLQKQRLRERLFSLAPNERRLRSPQDIKRRRSAIFSASDLPDGYFNGVAINNFEITDFVERIRRMIIEAAITQMWGNHELEYLNGTWYIKVSVLDRHIAERKRGKGSSSKVKRDDRSFHGRPNNARKRPVAS